MNELKRPVPSEVGIKV